MKNGSNLIIVCLMLVYVSIAIPKRVLYAIKIIIIPPFKIEQRQESFSESPQNID